LNEWCFVLGGFFVRAGVELVDAQHSGTEKVSGMAALEEAALRAVYTRDISNFFDVRFVDINTNRDLERSGLCDLSDQAQDDRNADSAKGPAHPATGKFFKLGYYRISSFPLFSLRPPPSAHIIRFSGE
jgi:hypothetical protein